ncbi:MAG: sugar phosphate isomerase/epimerase [Lachnospiraceae bacterium]|nr:sugar phosphate isomerase/epimerase [Lachnospiraceae bacterium]
MKLATTIADLRGYTENWAEAVRAYEGTGFRYLDFDFYWTIYPGSPFLSDDWMRDVYDAANEAAKLGFTFVQAHAPSYNALNPSAVNPAANEKTGPLALQRSIAACGELGIPNLVIHSVHSPELRYPDDRERYFPAARAYYEALYPYMEKYNVNVLVENIDQWNMGGRYYFRTGEEIRSFLDFCGHPLLHACWDAGHANIEGLDQAAEILALGDHLRAVHIQDNFGEHDDHLAPFMGTLDLDAVMQGLLGAGYKGYFTFEATCMFSLGEAAFHRRSRLPSVTECYLPHTSLELRRRAESLLYETGRYILTQYQCFEE